MVRGRERRLAAATTTMAMPMVAVALVAIVTAVAGIDARATYGARVTADEPQYLITAISLGEDFSLDVSDELAEERFLPFHEIPLNPQTIDLDDQGRRVSPHDPLLPLLLALPMLLGGWVGAKLALALCAGFVAALTLRLAVDRLGAPLGPASAIVAGFAAAPPFSAYGVQVYPAMPAALCVLGGVLALTATPAVAPEPKGSPSVVSSRRFSSLGAIDRSTVAIVLSVVALPWLSVKYVPMAAVVALAGLWRGWQRNRALPTGILVVYAIAGVTYLGMHQWLYGGWTVYAAGDHFVDGEFLVVGSDPDYPARTRRLIGLLVDRGFGLAAWNPVFIALPAALVWLARSGRPGRYILPAVFAAGWATATWVALTMHGWWWPGRQVVPVLPLAVAAVAAMVGAHRRALAGVLTGSLIGAGSWLILAWEASTDRRTLIVDFEQTVNPWYQLWRRVLPDHRRMDAIDVGLTVAWLAVLVVSCVVVARRTSPSTAGRQSTVNAGASSVDDGVEGEVDPSVSSG